MFKFHSRLVEDYQKLRLHIRHGLIGYWFLPALLLHMGMADSHATTLKYIKFNDLIRNASEIVLAKVTECRSYWDSENHGIWTDYQIHIIQSFKRNFGGLKTLVVRQRGGTIREQSVSQVVIGNVEMERGDTVLLFLAAIDSSVYRSLGMFQGIFHVKEENDRRIVFRPRTSANLKRNDADIEEMDQKLMNGPVDYQEISEKIKTVLSISNKDMNPLK